MKPPTPLTNDQFVENLRTVLNAVCDGLAAHPARVGDIRNGDHSILIHSQGVAVIRQNDLETAMGLKLVEEAESFLDGII